MADKSPRSRKHKKRKQASKHRPTDDDHNGKSSGTDDNRTPALAASSSSSDSAEDSVDGPTLAESAMPLAGGESRLTSAQEQLEKARAPLQQLRDIIEVKLRAKGRAENKIDSAMENEASRDEGEH